VKHIPRQRLAFALCRVGVSNTEIEEARAYLQEAGYTVLGGELPEKAAYRRASDEGRTVTETHFTSLNRRAEALAQSIVNALASLTAREPKQQRRKRHGKRS
jgi:chromosome partitioning protein